MKKSNKRLIAKCLCLLSFISILVTVIVVSCLSGTSVVNPEFININKVYSGSEKEITSSTYTISNKYTPISEVVETNISNYQDSGDDKKIISLSTSDDLATLSSKAYKNLEYLKCNYILLNNITYTSTTAFIPLGWQESGTTVSFSGTFDGNGYDIANIRFISINATNKSTYGANEYFAFVAKNSGTIKNVGLIDPSIAISDFMDSLGTNGVANFCGVNSGTIDSCYVRQLSRSIQNECGITALGGYRISGFVIDNIGTISNSYLATNSIYNRTCTDMIEFADIALANTGTLTNVYFYNGSIDSNKSSFTAGGAYSFTYVSDLGNSKGKSGTNYPGTWVKTLDELRGLSAFSSWTSTVGSGANTYTYVTPVKRTITLNNNVFSISSANDFVMLYELINLNAVFASSTFTYSITQDIDMSYISSDALIYNRGIGATITGAETTSSVKLITGETNNYPTIYNLDITNTNRYVTNLGVNAYGFIPYYTGNMSNLNFYYSNTLNSNTLNLDNISTSTNLTAFGCVVGYLETGSINNVNVYANINSSTSNKLKESYIGGVCGIIGESSVSNITASGSINLACKNSYTQSTTYAQGTSIGGLVGFSENTYSSVSNALNAMNITATLSTANNYSISGIVGGGYFTSTSKLENKGSITITSTSHSNLYVSGVIGRLLGIRNQISELTNQGTVSTTLPASATSYVSGILNADIVVSASNSFTRSEFTNTANQCLFYASSLSNRADVAVTSSSSNLYYTSGINVLSTNGFVSEVSNLYNLSNTETYKANTTTGKYTNSLGSQNIDMAITPNYAGLVNNITGTSTTALNLSESYNLRDITFTDSTSLSTDMYYAAVARGSNINYSKIYNEGKLTFTVSNSISSAKTLNISGVFEELSNGYTARYIFNGADINFVDNVASTSSTYLNLNLNIAGIVLNNKSIDNSTSQNPTKSDFDKESIGTLDNAINNGNIKVTSTNLDKTMTSASSTTVTTITFPKLESNTKLNGNINASGITVTNNGIISNTFNLGDVDLEVFAKSAVTYNASGIACKLDGEYAAIKNSANNGDISVINMANMKTSSGTASLYTEYVSGIVGINNTNNTNVNETISFTINYGTIKGYSGYVNNAYTKNANYSYVGGILAYGACNIVNVLNYGNIYGAEVVGSIAGKLDLSFTASTNVYLANTINYGNIKLLKHYNVSGTTIENASFTDIENLESKYTSVGTYGTIDTYNYAYVGAMFGIVDFASGNKASLNIRYVLNFYQGQSITQDINQRNKPTSAIDTTTFMTCKDANDTFGSGSIKFAPLSTVSDSAGNIGVFSTNFIFRRAINGDSTAVDYNNYISDKYITDYFSFVVYDKVNTYLIEKIGWRNVAYLTAAEELARNVSAMSKFVSKGAYTKDGISAISSDFSGTSWTSNIDSTLLNNAIVEIINNKELTSEYEDIIKYFVFDSTYTSSVYNNIKNNIISSIINCLDNDSNNDYTTLIQTLLYDEVLAKVVAGDDANYTLVQTKINSVLDSISSSELRTIITNYLNNIASDSTILNNMFDNDTNNYYTLAKYNLINTLLEGYSDETINLLTSAIVGSNTLSNNALKYYEYLKNNSNVSKEVYATILTSNGLSSSTSINSDLQTLLNKAFKSYTTDINSSIDSLTTVSPTDSYTSKSGFTYINGSNVSYSKDYTELWNIVKNYSEFTSYLTKNSGLFNTVTDPTSSIQYNAVIAKATEYNSTYQSEDSPSEKDTNETNKTSGKIYVTDKKANVYNRFIYTPDSIVSTNTYYYGPFNAYGRVLNDAANFSSNSNFNSDIYNASNKTSTYNFYTPFFMSLDERTRTTYINESNTRSTAQSVGLYYWNTGTGSYNSNQWVSDYIIYNRADNVQNFLQKNSNTGEYIVNGFDFANYSTYNNGTTIDTAGTTEAHLALLDKYITGYGTSQVYTGIWYPVSVWYEDSKVVGVYLCTQDITNDFKFEGSYKGVQTTEYTYYTIDDLVNLDGVRTKGKSNGSTDSDEVSIISAIMTKVLSADEGKKAVVNALASYASTESFTSSQQASMYYLATALKSTDFASKFSSELVSLQSETTLKNLSYDNSYSSVYLKLEVLVENATFSNKQALAFYTANNKTAFIELLKYGLTDFSDYDNDDGTNTITSSDFTYHLSNYISYLKTIDSHITASQIVEIINSVKDTDIEYLEKLDDLTWSDFIDYLDQDAYDKASFGGSVDFSQIYSNIVSLSSDSTYKTWFEIPHEKTEDSDSNDSTYPKTGYVYPLITGDDKITSLENNIGYFTGSNKSAKIYEIKSENVKDKTTIYKGSSNGYSNVYSTIDSNIKDSIDTDLKNTNFYGMVTTGEVKVSKNKFDNPVTISSTNTVGTPYVAGKNANGYIIPAKSLWFVPQQNGYVKMVLFAYDGRLSIPTIYQISRSDKTKNENVTLTTITKAYIESDGTRTYNSSSSGTLVYDSSWYSSLTSCNLYYLEIPVTKDVEYAVGYTNTSSGSAYITYLDIGQNASDYYIDYPNLSTIESNYNTYYNSGAKLSNFANTILAKDMIKVDYKSSTLIGTTEHSVTVSEPTILLVKTNQKNIPITVTGNSTYNNSIGESVTVSKVTINSKSGYTGFYLSGNTNNTYTISATSDCISEILLVKKDSEFTTEADSKNLLHVKYNGSDLLSGITSYSILKSYKLNVSQSLLDTLKVVYPTIKETTSGTTTTYSIFKNNVFTSDKCKEIIEGLAKADDNDSSTSVLAKLINSANSHYEYILNNVDSYEAKVNILNKVIKIESSGDYSKTQDNIIATFIGQNYLNYSNNNSLKSSVLYTLLNTYESGKYQFITGDSTIDYDKFDAFLEHLGITSSMSGYGIYALSSSLGQKNGIFIPDNFDLTGMDANYKNSSNGLVVDDNTSSYWRDNTANTTTTYDVTNTNSVNYKFRKEMKQLKLSISTEILEADITSGDYSIYATDTTIDSQNGIIYYYVPSSYIDYLTTISNANIKLTIASSASCSVTTIDFTKGDYNDLHYYVVPNVILVTAEDTTVTTNYSIYLIPQDITINSITTTTTSIPSTGAMVEFSIKTTNAPDNFDLTPYLTVNGVKLSATDKHFYLDETLYNNGVVTNNTATLKLYIEGSHVGGSIPFVIDVYGSSKAVSITKTKSSESTFAIEFEGANVTFNSNVATSSIRVGMIYTKEELESLTYLTSYTFASNATYQTSATYNNTTLGNGRYQYIITVKVTSEDESSTTTYTHYLNEMDYFDSTYANIYQDGNIVSDLYQDEFTSGDETYNTSGKTTSLTYDNSKTNFAAVAFARGNEYEYRIKYVLNNFYVDDDIEFSVASASTGCSIQTPSAGMTVVVGNNQELGEYYFNYKYTHTVQYDDSTQITREYIFPTLFVIKREGEDSLLKRLTFLENTEIIGNTATIIQADTYRTTETKKVSSIVVSKTGVSNLDGSETTYEDETSSRSHAISITNNSSNSNENISYGNLESGLSTKDISITDYYAIGTVNETELSYYAPKFGIDEHSQMYQYTTKRKLEEYGNTNKTGSTYSDSAILGDHSESNTTYIYVPFDYTENGETKTKIFYVELDSNLNWTKIYQTTETPSSNNYIATFVNSTTQQGITAKEATDGTKASFTYSGVTYTVSASAGKPTDNMSLYMDYIGSPLVEHFWYVSYMVLSESAVAGNKDSGNVRYYHISIIDATNNIYFEATLYSTVDLGSEIYMTISENIYSGTIKKSSRQISGHFDHKEELTSAKTLTYTDGTSTVTEEYSYCYTLRYKLSTLPKGYFSFYLDLENGYSVSTTTSDANQISTSSDPGKSEAGTFLPYTSIITRTIKLNFYVKESNSSSQTWGVKVGDIFTTKATYMGKEENNQIS